MPAYYPVIPVRTTVNWNGAPLMRAPLLRAKRDMLDQALRLAEIAEVKGFPILAGDLLEIAEQIEGCALATIWEPFSTTLITLAKRLDHLDYRWQLQARNDRLGGMAPAAFEAQELILIPA